MQKSVNAVLRFQLLRMLIACCLILPTSLTVARAQVVWVDQRQSLKGPFSIVSVRSVKVGFEHAYVAIYSQSDRSMTSAQRYIGFYPNTNTSPGSLGGLREKASLFYGAGKLNEEYPDIYRATPISEVNVVVDEAQLAKINQSIEEFSKGKDYGLLWRDCTTFVSRVLGSIGVLTPSRIVNWMPSEYVAQMANLNRSRRSWLLKVSNIDDVAFVRIAGGANLQCNFMKECAFDLSSMLRPGRNQVSIGLKSVGGPYSFSYALSRDGQAVISDQCGSLGNPCTRFGGPFPVGQGAFEKELATFDIFID